MNCKVSKYLAYSMAVYTMASLFYFVETRSLGTPFNDTLTQEQKQVKADAVKVRKNIFYKGAMLSSLILFLAEPFKSC